MVMGKTPFQAATEYLIFEKIKNCELKIGKQVDSDTQDLIEKLIVFDYNKRFGAGRPGEWNDMNALKSHPFFKGIEWDTLFE
jgi:3-phosphoinositide dependent protein kinase-1